MTCIPMATGNVIPIQEKIKRCNRRFMYYNKVCNGCIAYKTCKKNFLDNIKVPKGSIVNIKGKRPTANKKVASFFEKRRNK